MFGKIHYSTLTSNYNLCLFLVDLMESVVKPKKRKKWRELDKRIRLLKSEYEHGNRSLDDYWDAMAHVVKQFN